MYKRLDIKAPLGVNFTREPSQLDLTTWDNGEEIAFRYGVTKKVNGWEQAFGVPPLVAAPPLAIEARRQGADYVWTYATQNAIYNIANVGDHQVVTPTNFQLAPGYKWCSDSIYGVPYYGQASYYPWVLTKFEAAKYFPTHVRAQVFRTFKNHVIAMNIQTVDFDPSVAATDTSWCPQLTVAQRSAYAAKFGSWSGEQDNPSAIWWSDEIIGDELDVSWADADPTAESGWNFLGGTGGRIIDGLALRDSFIIYRDDTVWQMSYIGGVQVFAFKELFNDNGILNTNCVTDIGGQHIVVGQGDVYLHNGVQKSSIVDGIIRQEIFNSIDPQFVSNVFVASRYSDKEAWICIPEMGTNINGACNVAYVYNWEERTWARRSMPNALCSAWGSVNVASVDESWEAESEALYNWDEASDTWLDTSITFSVANIGMLFGGVDEVGNSALYVTMANTKMDGKTFEAWVEKKWIDCGDNSSYKTLNKIFPLVRDGVVDVYVSGSRTTYEAPTWKKVGTYNPESGRMHIAATTTGRFLHVKFVIPKESNAEIKGYTLEYKESGVR